MRHLQRGVAHLARLLTEDRAQQPLLRRQLGLALGRDLADQDVAGADLGADADDAALVEVGEDLLGDVRDVAGDLLRAQLGVAGVDLVLLDVDRGEHVVLHEALAQDDRVFVVVALPRHERHEQVAAERHLALVGGRAVGDDRADLDRWPSSTIGRWLRQVPWLERRNFAIRYVVRVPSSFVTVTASAETSSTTPAFAAVTTSPASMAARNSMPVPTSGASDFEQRHRLALHVRAHQRAVGVVVLEERDHRGRDRDHLARRDVHVVDLRGRDEVDLAALTADEHAVLGEVVVVVSGALACAMTKSSSSSAVR